MPSDCAVISSCVLGGLIGAQAISRSKHAASRCHYPVDKPVVIIDTGQIGKEEPIKEMRIYYTVSP